MSRITPFVGILALMLMISPFVRGEEATTQPAKEDKVIKIVEPWSKITTLSDDQKQKIADIHSKALEQMKQIRDTEKADIMALLNDDQKAELKKAGSEARADAKEKKADKTDAAAQK